MSLPLLAEGVAAVQREWADAGRQGRPRIVTGRYFCLGEDAPNAADEYIRHYYGPEFFGFARADTLTDSAQISAELLRLSEAGCTDVLLYPCTGSLEQVGLLTEAVRAAGPTSAAPSRQPGRGPETPSG